MTTRRNALLAVLALITLVVLVTMLALRLLAHTYRWLVTR